MKLKPYVEVTGNGPALVLIHGWGLHGGIWETVVASFANNFTVYNLDLPGFGRSPVHNADYTLDYLVAAVASVVPDDAYVLGWSLGGLVATSLALTQPQKVKKLITVASNPAFVADENWQYAMQAQILQSFIDYLQDDYQGTLIRFLGIQTMGSATQKEDIKRLKETVFLHGQPSAKALKGGLKILQSINLVKQLPQLSQPLLRLYGRLDSLVPVKVAAQIDELLPASQSIIYRKSAHAPFLSANDEFIEDVTSFLLGSQVGDQHAVDNLGDNLVNLAANRATGDFHS
ncbi:pimeloyl-ACP methyl ester esterase BioH [Aliikangiella maris]|uniref:Pimeloyl-ACP methyl ester esterase BioH n=2 Tax=Aliikangiella maris TaxID=3162458 RepID=A0ABV3MTP7_9GAMM